ncbi:MAG: 50S ribosomal protein L6 [Candidatus Falkowbacteria bacterium]|nr:50S ribosomal protein L6 [Candidatus Falkowbacteria bacterium]
MSRLGKLPIELSKDVQVKIENGFIIVKGPKGELKQKLNDLTQITILDSSVVVGIEDKKDSKSKAMWGLMRALINNMVIGVTKGFEKILEINGVGYKATGGGSKITLNIGFSHPVNIDLPDGVTAKIEGNTIKLEGINKQMVGEMAASIRKLRKPEPYKGKGIKYKDEVIIRKEGKTAAKGE